MVVGALLALTGIVIGIRDRDYKLISRRTLDHPASGFAASGRWLLIWPGCASLSGATAMLSAITTGIADDLLAAAKEFDSACDKAGL